MSVLNRVTVDMSKSDDPSAWYFKVPAVAQIVRDGLELATDVTVVVGDNGSGKSTALEAIASAWRRRVRSAVKHWGPEPASEDSDLHWILDLDAATPIPAGGCFLRAESMHQLFDDTDDTLAGTPAFAAGLNERSHGESFLDYLESRSTERGLFILDEPEAALSFQACLRLLSLVHVLVKAGSQVLMATHSPVLAAFPRADILLFDETGITSSRWNELDMVEHWRSFLNRPELYLRHLFDD